MLDQKDIEIRYLKKKIKDLEFVHGLCDKFGSYKSVQKDAEILWFFYNKEKHLARWIEIITAFKQRGWAKSTIENHLNTLCKQHMLVKGDLPGEYKMNREIADDMDRLAEWLLGYIYILAKKTSENKSRYQ